MNSFSAFMEDLVAQGVFPGYELALICGGELREYWGGYSQLYPSRKLLLPGLKYDLASLTKVVASVPGFLLLRERGLLSLDDRVDKFIEFPHPQVRLRHLLTHSSGLRADLDWRNMTRDQMLKSLLSPGLDEDKFEKAIVYSDIGYMLMGLIIDRVTGSMEDFLHEEFFGPLKMKDTGFNPSGECLPTELSQWRGLVRGQVHDEKAYILGGVAGHAGLFSSLGDLVNFVRMIMAGGVFEKRQILKEESIELIRKTQVDLAGNKRSIGWIITGKDSPYCDSWAEGSIFHAGFTGPSILINFEGEVAVVFLTNRIHPSRDNEKLGDKRKEIHRRLLDTLCGEFL